MRRISQFVLASFAAVAASAASGQQLTANFNDVTALPGAGWVFTNNSAPVGASGWFQGNPVVFSAQAGATDSYLAANFNAATFGGNISLWALTPNLTNLQNGEVLSFYTRTETGAPAPDRLEVRLSLNGASTDVGANDTSVGDFTTVLVAVNSGLTSGTYPESWTQYQATLSGLPAGPNSGRIGFRYFVTDTSANGDYIGIDTVALTNLVADLAVTATHSGNFTQGQAGATYAITVSNVGTGGSGGTVTVTDTLPAGLTPTNAVGSGWSCGIAAQVVTCTRSDVLAAGASWPTITITVDVSAGAAASLDNVVTVSGGSETNLVNDSAIDTTVVLAGGGGTQQATSVPTLGDAAMLLLAALVALVGLRGPRRA